MPQNADGVTTEESLPASTAEHSLTTQLQQQNQQQQQQHSITSICRRRVIQRNQNKIKTALEQHQQQQIQPIIFGCS